MTGFHYKVNKPLFGSRKELLFTDTDSFRYDIQTDDIYKHMADMKEYFDMSSYESDHFLFSNKHKKTPGQFKEELSGKLITENIGLRPKIKI